VGVMGGVDAAAKSVGAVVIAQLDPGARQADPREAGKPTEDLAQGNKWRRSTKPKSRFLHDGQRAHTAFVADEDTPSAGAANRSPWPMFSVGDVGWRVRGRGRMESS